jgi:DNA-binding XRE family transcriptional regulator
MVDGVRVRHGGVLVESFGAVLRGLRLAVGWTQERLARASGVSAHTIITLESGKRRPRLSTVVALADGLELGGSQRDRLIAAARVTAGAAAGAAAGDTPGDAGDPVPVTGTARSDLPRAIGASAVGCGS